MLPPKAFMFFFLPFIHTSSYTDDIDNAFCASVLTLYINVSLISNMLKPCYCYLIRNDIVSIMCGRELEQVVQNGKPELESFRALTVFNGLLEKGVP